MTYVLPIEPVTMHEQIYDYVVEHPNCTRDDIMAALGCSTGAISVSLSRLRRRGEVFRYPASGGSHKEATWSIDPSAKPAMKDGLLYQRTVREWEPVKAGDPLIDLFFGRVA